MRGKKAQAALEFVFTYGWAIFVVLVMIGVLAYFGVLDPKKFLPVKPENIIIDTDEELKDICNNLVVNGEPYDFLRVMGEGLKRVNNATDVVYGSPSLLISDVEMLKNQNLIFCKVPLELCWTELNFVGLSNYRDGSYCMLWKLEVKVDYTDFVEWQKKIGGQR